MKPIQLAARPSGCICMLERKAGQPVRRLELERSSATIGAAMCKSGVARLVKPLWRRNNTLPAVPHAGPHGLRFHTFCVCPPRPVSHRHHTARAVLDLEAVHVHRQLQVREDPRDTAQVPEMLDLGLATAIFGAQKPCHKLLCNTSPTRRRRATLRDGQYLAW